jgi:hypothetical protein
MSKHAIRNPGGGAHALGRLLEAGPYRTLVVLVVAALAVAAVAIPRYRAAIAGTSTKTVSAPVLHVQAPEPVAAPQTELPSPATNATAAENRSVTNSMSSVPVKVQRGASEKKVSEGSVTRKWNGDWQAATAHLGSGPVDARTASSVAPAATVSHAADGSSGSAETASAMVTMTGCLEVSIDNEEFRLTETEGANVPKARSWRSGFLRKQAAPVELLELADPATARKYVGQRVVVTGAVENREMRVRSLQTSGKGCD